MQLLLDLFDLIGLYGEERLVLPARRPVYVPVRVVVPVLALPVAYKGSKDNRFSKIASYKTMITYFGRLWRWVTMLSL